MHRNHEKIAVTGTFGSVLHPDDAYTTKTSSEDDWNPQTLEDAKKPGTHPWAVHTAAKVSDERAVWEFADANKDIDIITNCPLPVNSPPLSPNYVHVWDDATLHVAALKAAPAPGTQRRVLAVAGTVLWPQTLECLAESHPQLKDRACVVSEDYVVLATIAAFENKNAAVLGLSSFKGWVEAFGDAVDALLSLKVSSGVRS
ncbi:hypothetical protein BC834DRAFT_971055 [Gloeopeniophorella convolvens]|nr:hypothetical protein BC834DRAFT_971055 [Gloeopeniophorella convolvens]